MLLALHTSQDWLTAHTATAQLAVLMPTILVFAVCHVSCEIHLWKVDCYRCYHCCRLNFDICRMHCWEYQADGRFIQLGRQGGGVCRWRLGDCVRWWLVHSGCKHCLQAARILKLWWGQNSIKNSYISVLDYRVLMHECNVVVMVEGKLIVSYLGLRSEMILWSTYILPSNNLANLLVTNWPHSLN